MSLRQDIIAVLNGHESRRGEGNGAIYENQNVYNIRDNEIEELKTILNGEQFSEHFYNVESDRILVWRNDINNFVDLATGLVYYATLFFEDFESGSLATNGWVKVDGGENDWEIGGAAKQSGNFGLYVSNDGGATNTYSSVGGGQDVSHVYIDIDIPSSATDIFIEFDWRCEGRIFQDRGTLNSCPTSVNPAANVELSDIYRIGNNEYNDQGVFGFIRVPVDAAIAGTTRRFVFSWRNNATLEIQPPMAIDNFRIIYA